MQFSFQFTGALLSFNKTTKMEYVLIEASEKFFLHPLAQKQKYYFFGLNYLN